VFKGIFGIITYVMHNNKGEPFDGIVILLT
jgi:hypothetical protein